MAQSSLAQKQQSAPLSANNKLRACLWMSGSILSFCLLAVAARQVQAYHDVFELMAYRSCIGMIFVLLGAWILGIGSQITTYKLHGHIARNVVHFSGQIMWMSALTMIPLAQLFALEFTTPLWVILLAPFFLGEKITSPRAIGTVLGFVGILIVAQPDFTTINWGILAGAACGICFAVNIILTKRLTNDVPLVAILFWLTVIQGILAFSAALWDGNITAPSLQSLPLLILIGITGLSGHLCVVKALKSAPASFVGPIDFLRLPLIAVIGSLLYGEPLTVSLAIGAALILAGTLYTLKNPNSPKPA